MTLWDMMTDKETKPVQLPSTTEDKPYQQPSTATTVSENHEGNWNYGQGRSKEQEGSLSQLSAHQL